MDKIVGFVVTAGHLDIEWYQAMRSYRQWIIEAFEDLKTISKTRKDFVTYCLDGQYFPLKEYLDVIPEDKPLIKEFVKNGLLSIGPFYTQFDEWLPSAESMIRNCLYGERLCKKFGGYMRAGYLPDNFGHPVQLAQILNGFDIDSLLFMRGMPEVPGGHTDEFIHKGIDGSELFVSHFRESYSGAFDIFNKEILPTQPRIVPYYNEYMSYEAHREWADHDDPQRIARSMVDNVMRIVGRYPTRIVPLIAGFDHLPPQINIGDSIKCANEMQDEIEFIMGNVEDYVLLAKKNLSKNMPVSYYDMELIGSKYQFVLLGALSTRTYIKRENFLCEALIEKYAEPLDVIASLYGYSHKQRLFDEAWEYLMINSAHDSIHGSSLDDVHLEMMSRYACTRQIAAAVIHDAMKYAGRQMSPWAKKDNEVLVFAPQTAENQTAELWLPVNQPLPVEREGWRAFSQPRQFVYRDISLIDEEGRVLLTQIEPREPIENNGLGKPRNSPYPGIEFQKVLFQGNFKAGQLYRLSMDVTEKTASELTGGPNFLENSLIRVDVHGALISILDKRSGFSAHNLNLLEEEADAGDAWDYSPTWTPGEIVRSTQFPFVSKLKSLGQVRGKIEISGKISVPKNLSGDDRSFERAEIPVVFEVSLDAGAARVDIKLWFNNTANDHRVRLRVPVPVKTDFVRSQSQLAIVDRKIERQKEIEPWVQPPTQLLPCREWVAVQDNQHGIAIALKGMYDYEAIINPLSNQPDLFITLLRGFDRMGRLNTLQRKGDASMSAYTPGAQCHGEQNIEWAYVLYRVDDNEKAPFIKSIWSYLYPPVAHAIRAAHENTAMDSVSAPYAVENPNIQFSALKLAYDNDGYILRLYENQGKKTEAFVRLSPIFKRAEIVNMNERTLSSLEIKDGGVYITFEPYKAVTLKLASEL